jgi:hypothetical protein
MFVPKDISVTGLGKSASPAPPNKEIFNKSKIYEGSLASRLLKNPSFSNTHLFGSHDIFCREISLTFFLNAHLNLRLVKNTLFFAVNL